ncbi:hypothetical protein GCM10009756_12850 [Pseudokineococcus marinus]
MKYMAKSPAKNISSLDSHTIVPTEVMFGRLTVAWPTAVGTAVSLLTGVSMDDAGARHAGGARVSSRRCPAARLRRAVRPPWGRAPAPQRVAGPPARTAARTTWTPTPVRPRGAT